VKRALRVLRAASVWTLFLLSSGLALAEDATSQSARTTKADAEPGARSGPAGAKTDPGQAASIAYQDALASYAKGDLAAALNSMRESYRLSKRPELLYNLAQLEEELKACSDSLEDYRRYLELAPQGRYREAAESASRRLQRECPPPTPQSSLVASTLAPGSTAASAAPAATTAAAAPASTTAAAAPATNEDAAKPRPAATQDVPYWTAPRIIGWSALAAGTLAGVGALYFQLEAIHARTELQQDVDNGPPIDTSLQTRQHRTNSTAIALAITGGALIASGAVVLLLDSSKHDSNSRSARLYAAPGLLGACYTQGF